MAELLYGHIYFQDRFAGLLRQETGDRCSFSYDSAYLNEAMPAIALTLPLQAEPHIYSGRLHPYFDNLLAEGRQAAIQARWLGVPVGDRFARLLAFGGDCIGAVTIRDPRPRTATGEMPQAAGEIAALTSRASISGVQAKLLAVETETGFRPAREGELSTHIAKLSGGNLPEIVPLEHLSTLAAGILLPDDELVETRIAPVEGIDEGIDGECLLIRRFDRLREDGATVKNGTTVTNGTTLKRHFEEFNQILGHSSEDKYEGTYAAMAQIMRENPRCSLLDVERLFRRILVSILLGNNDAHLKNFGLLYLDGRLRLAPFYDVLAVALYPDFSQTGMALRLGQGTNPASLAGIGPSHLDALASSFGLKKAALREAAHDLGRRLDAAQETVREAPHGSQGIRTQLAEYMRKRWNGTFQQVTSSTGRRS
jgi:serine/threonine-protein kinase HipA